MIFEYDYSSEVLANWNSYLNVVKCNLYTEIFFSSIVSIHVKRSFERKLFVQTILWSLASFCCLVLLNALNVNFYTQSSFYIISYINLEELESACIFDVETQNVQREFKSINPDSPRNKATFCGHVISFIFHYKVLKEKSQLWLGFRF